MTITPDLFGAFLKCPTKCWLRAAQEPASGNAYAEWVKSQNEAYRATETDRLLSETPKDESAVSPPTENLKTAQWRLAVGLAGQASMNSCIVESGIQAMERVPSEGRGKPAQFIPIRFIFTNKLGRDEKLLLGFDGVVLSTMLGREVGFGKIIHGDDHATQNVKISALAGDVRKRIDKIAALLSIPAPPDLILNRHCAECEFQTRCRQKAIEKDDPSLLAGMNEKERKKLHSKGIFTVTQLSYTFRPRRRPRRMPDKREKYHHSLKALAIREKKIHIVGSPELKIEGTPVYLDVEGLPDRDFYYLIGLRIGNGESAVQHSLWADAVEDEVKIWREFQAILEKVEKPVLIHYGSYETTFLKRMAERFGGGRKNSVAGKAIQAALNLLSVTFARVYFPSFSNGLKEIAVYLGFRWSDETATGIRSITWRQSWEISNATAFKKSLILYNGEDCAALEVVANKLIDLHQGRAKAESPANDDVVDAAKLRWEHPYGFKSQTFVIPELNAINKAAYWDYQRERVYVKSNTHVKRAVAKPKKARRVLSANKTIECPRPRHCPQCLSKKFFKHTKYTKTRFDIKFMRHGIKRWITRYRFHRYLCQTCKTVFQPVETSWGKGKLGPEIIAYALYLSIELRMPQMHVDNNLNKLFNFDLPIGTSSKVKEQAAKTYRTTYESLLKRLCNGQLLHADETKVIWGNNTGFVWVFASMEEVAYVYSETREGDLLKIMLKDFKGVLVSDFYAAYDAIDCPQQKCLIHLIRDINDDLLKNPYDEDLRLLAMDFVLTLKPMVETIDLCGLKSRFLRKHLPTVNQFYRRIASYGLHSDTALKLRDRFEKNQKKLFTFLTFNGVPWNNNNAEHAVKPFAKLRQVFGASSTEKGIREYLVLLSVCQTCKYMGVEFLDFLRSGETDIHAFAASRFRRRRQPDRDRPDGDASA